MAKDDYYVIVYKILAYLYIQLKNGEDIEADMLTHDGKLFKINKKYWIYIIEHMLDDGYIEGLVIKKTFGRDIIILGWDDLKITPKGIDYLCNNSTLEKAKEFLKNIKEITPFI